MLEKISEILSSEQAREFYVFLKQLSGAALIAWYITKNTLIQEILQIISNQSIVLFEKAVKDVLSCEKCITFTVMLVLLISGWIIPGFIQLAIFSSFLMANRDKVIGKWF